MNAKKLTKHNLSDTDFDTAVRILQFAGRNFMDDGADEGKEPHHLKLDRIAKLTKEHPGLFHRLIWRWLEEARQFKRQRATQNAFRSLLNLLESAYMRHYELGGRIPIYDFEPAKYLQKAGHPPNISQTKNLHSLLNAFSNEWEISSIAEKLYILQLWLFFGVPRPIHSRLEDNLGGIKDFEHSDLALQVCVTLALLIESVTGLAGKLTLDDAT